MECAMEAIILGAAISTLICVIPGRAVANDAAVNQVGGTLRLMEEHPSVALLAEEVVAHVDAKRDSVSVVARFLLVNTGQASDVLIGFPEDYDGDTGARPFFAFKSYVDGEETPVERVRATEAHSAIEFWWIKKVHFEAGQARWLREEYSGRPGGDSGGGSFFEYVLYTGDSWQGKVGIATIEVDLDGAEPDYMPVLDQRLAQSGEVRRTDRGCRWVLRNFDPAGTVYLHWQPPKKGT
jgi:hypothetical protein